MGLYTLFSYNVEVQYKSCLFSKAMLFTLILTILTLTLPFLVAYKSRGFWLRSQKFYEQPAIHFTYEYLLVAESDDPSYSIVCNSMKGYIGNDINNEEHCTEFQVQEHDVNSDGKVDLLDFKYYLDVPKERTITSVALIFLLDFQLKTICPLHMQSLAVINREFMTPPSGFKYLGDLQFYQISHLPCKPNMINTKYNNSILFTYAKAGHNNIVDSILDTYYMREVATHTNTLYSRIQNGHTGSMQVQASVRVPEMEIKYTPSLMQELKWAWPQYLSLAVIFYWIFNKIRLFVFFNRLFMAWEIVPWKKPNRKWCY
ncbi:unnamed protein product [Chrysodeixis includens]|uniref:Transmembrane protein 231 n=1 Tax=Chrysodeixis includens TaxID=689277 RepID=A0A9P0C2S9_CHRIL|nr:unnamed protein product [Chrysodeixis includens]